MSSPGDHSSPVEKIPDLGSSSHSITDSRSQTPRDPEQAADLASPGDGRSAGDEKPPAHSPGSSPGDTGSLPSVRSGSRRFSMKNPSVVKPEGERVMVVDNRMMMGQKLPSASAGGRARLRARAVRAAPADANDGNDFEPARPTEATGEQNTRASAREASTTSSSEASTTSSTRGHDSAASARAQEDYNYSTFHVPDAQPAISRQERETSPDSSAVKNLEIPPISSWLSSEGRGTGPNSEKGNERKRSPRRSTVASRVDNGLSKLGLFIARNKAFMAKKRMLKRMNENGSPIDAATSPRDAYRNNATEQLKRRQREREGLQPATGTPRDEKYTPRVILLEEVDLSKLGLESIRHVEFRGKVRVLNLSFNRLTDLPLLDLPHLKKMSLSYNRLTTGQSLSLLTAVEELEMGWNNMQVLEGLEAMGALKYLDLRQNKFTEPECVRSVSFCVNLLVLLLSGNPWKEQYGSYWATISNYCGSRLQYIDDKKLMRPVSFKFSQSESEKHYWYRPMFCELEAAARAGPGLASKTMHGIHYHKNWGNKREAYTSSGRGSGSLQLMKREDDICLWRPKVDMRTPYRLRHPDPIIDAENARLEALYGKNQKNQKAFLQSSIRKYRQMDSVERMNFVRRLFRNKERGLPRSHYQRMKDRYADKPRRSSPGTDELEEDQVLGKKSLVEYHDLEFVRRVSDTEEEATVAGREATAGQKEAGGDVSATGQPESASVGANELRASSKARRNTSEHAMHTRSSHADEDIDAHSYLLYRSHADPTVRLQTFFPPTRKKGTELESEFRKRKDETKIASPITLRIVADASRTTDARKKQIDALDVLTNEADDRGALRRGGGKFIDPSIQLHLEYLRTFHPMQDGGDAETGKTFSEQAQEGVPQEGRLLNTLDESGRSTSNLSEMTPRAERKDGVVNKDMQDRIERPDGLITNDKPGKKLTIRSAMEARRQKLEAQLEAEEERDRQAVAANRAPDPKRREGEAVLGSESEQTIDYGEAEHQQSGPPESGDDGYNSSSSGTSKTRSFTVVPPPSCTALTTSCALPLTTTSSVVPAPRIKWRMLEAWPLAKFFQRLRSPGKSPGKQGALNSPNRGSSNSHNYKEGKLDRLNKASLDSPNRGGGLHSPGKGQGPGAGLTLKSPESKSRKTRRSPTKLCGSPSKMKSPVEQSV
ncbi:unnamed protein product [Amoebophrya sp. A25]|nr:unnamed protein product [Amoebophrya sp. A25]|eukprot:GSA25T00008520001.1